MWKRGEGLGYLFVDCEARVRIDAQTIVQDDERHPLIYLISLGVSGGAWEDPEVRSSWSKWREQRVNLGRGAKFLWAQGQG